MGNTFIRSSKDIAATGREAEGFSKQTFDAFSFLLEKLDCGLSVESHYDYNWCLSLLVYSNRAPPDRAFFLHRNSGGIHLVDVSGDCYVPVGTFASFIGAITCIQSGVNEAARLPSASSEGRVQTSRAHDSMATPAAHVPVH